MMQQLEFRTGGLDYLGQMWTWVSGEAAVNPVTIVGQWSKVITCHSYQPRIELHGGSGRIEVNG